jgi:hypothetical protein
MAYFFAAVRFQPMPGYNVRLRYKIRPVQSVKPFMFSLTFSSANFRTLKRFFYTKKQCLEWFRYLRAVYSKNPVRPSFLSRGQLELF